MTGNKIKSFGAVILAIILAIILAAYLPVTAYAAVSSIYDRIYSLEIPSKVTVRVNNQRQLTVYSFPGRVALSGVIWLSSDDDVVLVDKNGNLTGVSPGEATVTASITDHNGKELTAECAVTVPATILKSIGDDLSYEEHPLYAGSSSGQADTAQFRADVSGALKKSKGKTATLSYNGQIQISAAALRSAAYIAEYRENAVCLQFNTMNEKKGVQGQLTIDPVLAKDLYTDVYTHIYTSSDRTGAIKKAFEKRLGQPVAVIRCAQAGSYGMIVEIAAKPDFSALETDNLRFYNYDIDTNTYKPIENMDYSFDKNGYIHLKTALGGVFVIVSE